MLICLFYLYKDICMEIRDVKIEVNDSYIFELWVFVFVIYIVIIVK